MAYYQWVDPNLFAEDATGMCLRFTQRVFQNLNPIYYGSAWEAWQAAVHKSYERNFPNDIAVPVFFSHYGWYGEPLVYKNWGHVLLRTRDGRFLSSPRWGYGQEWFNSIEEVERAFNCTFAGWALDIGGLTIGWPKNPTPTPPAPKPIPPKPKEIKVQSYIRTDRVAREKGKELPAGDLLYLHERSDVRSQATNIVGKVGPYVITAHVQAEGNPGDQFDLTLIWQDTKATPPKNSPHYPETVVIGPDGKAKVNVTFQRNVRSGIAVHARLTAPRSNSKPIKVTLFDTDAMLFTVA